MATFIIKVYFNFSIDSGVFGSIPIIAYVRRLDLWYDESQRAAHQLFFAVVVVHGVLKSYHC